VLGQKSFLLPRRNHPAKAHSCRFGFGDVRPCHRTGCEPHACAIGPIEPPPLPSSPDAGCLSLAHGRTRMDMGASPSQSRRMASDSRQRTRNGRQQGFLPAMTLSNAPISAPSLSLGDKTSDTTNPRGILGPQYRSCPCPDGIFLGRDGPANGSWKDAIAPRRFRWDVHHGGRGAGSAAAAHGAATPRAAVRARNQGKRRRLIRRPKATFGSSAQSEA
jgi:hypothetical protein